MNYLDPQKWCAYCGLWGSHQSGGCQMRDDHKTEKADMNDLNETVEAIIAMHEKREPDDFPTDYANLLDDAHKALGALGIYDRANTADRVAYLTALHDVVAKRPGMPTNKVGTPVVADIEKLLASPREICLAIVKAFGKRYGITP